MLILKELKETTPSVIAVTFVVMLRLGFISPLPDFS